MAHQSSPEVAGEEWVSVRNDDSRDAKMSKHLLKELFCHPSCSHRHFGGTKNGSFAQPIHHSEDHSVATRGRWKRTNQIYVFLPACVRNTQGLRE